MIGLADWLANHPQLVSSLVACSKEWTGTVPAGVAASLQPAQQVWELAIRTAAAEGAAQFCLSSYASGIPPTARLLGALPAATLTKLQLYVDSSSWYRRLGHLTSLQQLTLDMGLMTTDHPATDGCLCQIGQLWQLTELELLKVPVNCDLRQLPVQLQQIELGYQTAGAQHGNPPLATVVDLQHLVCLQHMKLVADELAAGSSLPPKLISLQLEACWAAGAVAGLSSMTPLTSLQLNFQYNEGTISSADIHALQQLPQLVELSVSSRLQRGLLRFAPAWQNLPLCNLTLISLTSEKELTRQEFQQLVQHIGLATTLTNLDIYTPCSILDAPEDPKFALCKHFTLLRKLQRLHLLLGHSEEFVEHDTQHLSNLVALTSLELGNHSSGPCIDAVTLSLLALNLTGLQRLSVNSSIEPEQRLIGCQYALPAIGRLTALESLWLERMPEADARRGLQLLTGLSRLTDLDGFERAGSEALQGFWNTIMAHRSAMTTSA